MAVGEQHKQALLLASLQFLQQIRSEERGVLVAEEQHIGLPEL